MLSADYHASILAEARAIVSAAQDDLGRAVPQYPRWTVADLLSHTGSIHARTTLICRRLPQERISSPKMPAGMDPVDWLEESVVEMLEEVSRADPSSRVWAFGPEPVLGFWGRRMVVETGVHRHDVEEAFGAPDPLSLVVSGAGLEEFPVMWLPHLEGVQTLQVHATDLERSWVYGEANPTDAISGTASDVLLRLLSRTSPVALPTDWASAVDGMAPVPRPSSPA